jgi:CitB family two-component system response regulator MalR
MIRVMIVEDDPMVAEFNKRYLEEVRGFDLKAMVPSVDEAIRVLDAQNIDLIAEDNSILRFYMGIHP